MIFEVSKSISQTQRNRVECGSPGLNGDVGENGKGQSSANPLYGILSIANNTVVYT